MVKTYDIALDVTTDQASLALGHRDGHSIQLTFQTDLFLGRNASADLVPWVHEQLNEAHVSLNALARIIVPRGPGSFTGIRLGLAVAQGLSLALGITPLGLHILDFMAHTIRHDLGVLGPFVVLVPTHREDATGQLYDDGAHFPCLTSMTEPQVFSKKDLHTFQSHDIPLFWDRHVPDIFAKSGDRITWQASHLLLYAATIEAGTTSLTPLYVRTPSTTLPSTRPSS